MLPEAVNHRGHPFDNTSSSFSEQKAVFPTKTISGVMIPALDVPPLFPVESRATALVVRNKDNDRNRREAQKVAAREDLLRRERFIDIELPKRRAGDKFARTGSRAVRRVWRKAQGREAAGSEWQSA